MKTPVNFPPSTVLLEAATRGDIEEVKALLESGIDPNLANEDGLTGLHQACIDGNEDIINLFLEKGASLDATDRELWTPLHAATACGNIDVVEYLMDEGANIVAVNSDGNMPIDLVGEDDDELREVLEAEMEEQGYTEQKIEEIKELGERCMLAEIKDAATKDDDLDRPVTEQGATLLHIATANGYADVVEFLLEHGVSVDAKDKDGWEPIHGAAVWGNENVIQLLVESGADLDAKTPTGDTPLTLCEDPDLQTFIVDLKNKVKANKVKTGRRKRSNSRSLSVKRTSLKDKITISQNEAKAEAVLRVHPQLAFLIPSEERAKLAGIKPEEVKPEEVKPSDVTPAATTGTPTKNSTTTSPETRDNAHARTKETAGPPSPTKVTPPRSAEDSIRSRDRERDSPARLRDRGGGSPVKEMDIPIRGKIDSPTRKTEKENVEPNRRLREISVADSRTQAKGITNAEVREREKIGEMGEIRREEGRHAAPSLNEPTADNRAQNRDTPRQAPAAKTHSSSTVPRSGSPPVSSSRPAQKPTSQTALPSTEISGTGSLPKSTKSRPAPAPPLQHSSGSLSRNFEKSDTSGYPESFSKRSRGSRENIVDVAAAGRLTRPDPKAVSVGDVKISSGTHPPLQNADRSQAQPGAPYQTHKANNTRPPSAGSTPGQRTAGSNQGLQSVGQQNNDKARDQNAEKVRVQDDMKMREKKSCCVLM
ncbi:protein phosphatase 1 regulatory subunit 16A isoform X2 [Nematostella vectensis]|uniref:protein phosphatase 1 regulatory subunit 16A isoform X2 n=1 Tax=Nematostella vectensis TaxID=45351 RepID=UPI0020771B7E|nr:protein phosphatase 1 regulatory subunit 16A isoform X2 [Nematostella vectensis]